MRKIARADQKPSMRMPSIARTSLPSTIVERGSHVGDDALLPPSPHPHTPIFGGHSGALAQAAIVALGRKARPLYRPSGDPKRMRGPAGTTWGASALTTHYSWRWR